jgi:hypothetical protein
LLLLQLLLGLKSKSARQHSKQHQLHYFNPPKHRKCPALLLLLLREL